jgi:hypothetical protein
MQIRRPEIRMCACDVSISTRTWARIDPFRCPSTAWCAYFHAFFSLLPYRFEVDLALVLCSAPHQHRMSAENSHTPFPFYFGLVVKK